MTDLAPNALFQLRLPDGSVRLARGEAGSGPAELLSANLSVDPLIAAGGAALQDVVEQADPVDNLPADYRLLPPLGRQEVWAAGVTYMRSRDARIEEAVDEGDCYARVYAAARPELFFKSTPERVRASGEAIGVRADSEWNVPEPELALVLSPAMEVVAYTIGND